MISRVLLASLVLIVALSLHIHPVNHFQDNTDALQTQFHTEMGNIRKSISNRIEYFKKINSDKYKTAIDYNEKLLVHWDNLSKLA